jgi:ABC-type amino acid transport system permease subunit
VYLFVAVIYFIFSYAMSYASHKLEVALGVGER